MDEGRKLLRTARRWRRALLLEESLDGLFWLIVACCAISLAAAAVVAWNTTAGVWLARAGWAAAAAWWILRIVRASTRWHDLSDSAREAERRIAGTERLEWASAVAFATGQGTPEPTAELVRAYLAWADERLEDAGATALIDSRRLLRSSAAAMVSAAVVALCAFLWPRPFAPLFAAGSPGDSRLQPPWIAEMTIVYHYPAYSGRPARRIEGSDGNIVALAGTRVQISAQADRPLERAFVNHSGSRNEASVESSTVRTEFTVTRAGVYSFELHDKEGNTWHQRTPYTIRIEPDSAPRIEILEPKSDRQVKWDDLIDLAYLARDDFGLKQVDLVWRRSSSPAEVGRKTLKTVEKPARRLQGSTSIDLATFGLQPGERLELFLEARDNDDVNGPKTGRSRVIHLEVYSEHKEHRRLMERLQRLWERMLAWLADHLELEPRAEPRPFDPGKRYGEIADTGRRIAMDLKLLAREMAGDRLSKDGLYEAVFEVSRRQTERVRRLQWLLSRVKGTGGGDTFAGYRRVSIKGLEADVLYLEDLLDLARLELIEELSNRIADARRRLAELLEKYRKAPDEGTRRQIEREIARLKQTIADLLAQQRSVLKGVRDEYLNPEALAKLMGDRDMMGALDELQRLLNQGRIEDAMKQLDRLGNQLAAMQRALEQARRQLGAGRYEELVQKLGMAAAELGQIIEHQKKLAESTGKIRSQMLKKWKQVERASEKNWRSLERELDRIEEELKALEHLPAPFGMIPGQLDRARELTKLLRMGLKSRDPVQSLEEAKKLEQLARRIEYDERAAERFARMQAAETRAKQRKRVAHAKEAAAGAGKMRKQLERMQPDPERLLGPSQKAALRRMARRQSELHDRLGKLRQELERLDSQVPLLGERARARLGRSRSHMRAASDSLEKAKPGPAHYQQRKAIAELEAFQQDVKKSCQGGSGGLPLPLGAAAAGGAGRDMGTAGGRMQDGKVEIPSPDDFKTPEDFRKQLLEGMKDPVPEGYRGQVRQYYRELVK